MPTQKFGGDDAKITRVRRRRSTGTSRCSTPAPAARPPPSPSAASATCCSPGRTRPSSSLNELGADKFEIVVPPLSIKAEPPVALVDGNVDAKGTRKVAEAYLDYLYSDAAQKIIAKNFYRPVKPAAADPDGSEALPEAQARHHRRSDLRRLGKGRSPTHFADGGIFDQIYKPAQ